VESLAHRQDSTFAYALTGGADCMAELIFQRGSMRSALINEVPGTVGMVLTIVLAWLFRSRRETVAEKTPGEDIHY